MEWFQTNAAMIFAVLFGLSEVLAQMPYFKANSLFQLIYGLIQSIKPKSLK